MKKLALGLITAFSFANADFIGASIGVGLWQEKIDGYIKSDNNINYFSKEDNNPLTGNLNLQDETKPYIWAKIIHPIPLIPNIKAEYRQYHTKGKNGYVVGDFKLFDTTILKGAAAPINTDIKIDSYNITAFYELKFLFEVEAGVGVNLLDGKTKLSGAINSNTSWSVPIPYLYARVETPTIAGFSAEAEGKYLDISDAFYHDYQVAAKFHLPTPIIDISITAGYKTQEIYAKDGNDETDMKFYGTYMEVGARW